MFRILSCHYFTCPGLIWDVLRKMTSVKLDLITDFEMNEFIKKVMKEGVSYIAQ